MKKILRKYFSLKQAEKLIPKLEKRISKLMEINRIITLLNTVNVAYDDEFEGLITFNLPEFWNEKISKSYSNFGK